MVSYWHVSRAVAILTLLSNLAESFISIFGLVPAESGPLFSLIFFQKSRSPPVGRRVEQTMWVGFVYYDKI